MTEEQRDKKVKQFKETHPYEKVKTHYVPYQEDSEDEEPENKDE